jgi:hypothetical protein
MTWRSLGDSNPCFRRERALLTSGHPTIGLLGVGTDPSAIRCWPSHKTSSLCIELSGVIGTAFRTVRS